MFQIELYNLSRTQEVRLQSLLKELECKKDCIIISYDYPHCNFRSYKNETETFQNEKAAKLTIRKNHKDQEELIKILQELKCKIIVVFIDDMISI